MRVSIDCRALTVAPHSGIARQNTIMLQTLRQIDGLEVLPLTWAPADHPDALSSLSPRRKAPPNGLHRPLQRWHFESRFLPWALSARRVDVHVATLNMGLPIQCSVKKSRGARWVLQLHDVFQVTERNRHRSAWTERFYRQLDRASMAYAVWCADAIWVPSQYTAQCLAQLWPQARHKTQVLHNAVPSARWNAQWAPPPDTSPRYWLVVGSREPRKNIARLVRVWERACVEGASLPDLVVIGSRDDVPQASTRVRFVNGLSDDALAAWYQHAERVWHPAWAEGFGLPVVEAAACGVPLAVARGSSLDEVTPPGSLRFNPFDEAEMLACMKQAASVPRSSEETAPQLQRWAGQFNETHYAMRLQELLEDLT